jgi:hypothetical protein
MQKCYFEETGKNNSEAPRRSELGKRLARYMFHVFLYGASAMEETKMHHA